MLKRSNEGEKKEKKSFLSFWFELEREGERKKNLKLLSSIYRVSSVEIRRDKNESSSTRRGLHVGTKNTGFHQGFKGGVREIKGFGFRKCPQDFVEFLLRSKRYGFFLFWFFSILGVVWLSFNALRGCLAK